jgi:hypothetical protein
MRNSHQRVLPDGWGASDASQRSRRGRSELLQWAGKNGLRAPAMSTPICPLRAPMLSSATTRAIRDDAPFLQNMLDIRVGLARRRRNRRTIESRP